MPCYNWYCTKATVAHSLARSLSHSVTENLALHGVTPWHLVANSLGRGAPGALCHKLHAHSHTTVHLTFNCNQHRDLLHTNSVNYRYIRYSYITVNEPVARRVWVCVRIYFRQYSNYGRAVVVAVGKSMRLRGLLAPWRWRRWLVEVEGWQRLAVDMCDVNISWPNILVLVVLIESAILFKS